MLMILHHILRSGTGWCTHFTQNRVQKGKKIEIWQVQKNMNLANVEFAQQKGSASSG
jgi:hypothetical protein